MKRGLFILSHGSRSQEAEEIFSNIVEMVMNITSFHTIGMGSLQFSKPDLEEGIQDLIEQGIQEIVIVPLFIFEGHHVKYDIPKAVEKLKISYPQVRFILAAHIGADPRIAAIIEERARRALIGA